MFIGHRTFKAGAYINKQGHPANALFFVVRGTVTVYKEAAVKSVQRWPSGYNTWETVEVRAASRSSL